MGGQVLEKVRVGKAATPPKLAGRSIMQVLI
jgi:hypothetical protein